MSTMTKVTYAKDNSSMDKQYVKDLKSSDGSMASYGKKINSGSKPGTISASQCTGAMGKRK